MPVVPSLLTFYEVVLGHVAADCKIHYYKPGASASVSFPHNHHKARAEGEKGHLFNVLPKFLLKIFPE